MSGTDGERVRHRIQHRLAWQQALHDPVREPRNRLSTLPSLRRWQAERLATSFAALRADPRTREATEFFLTDLYGDQDFSARDRGVARVMPIMSRLLPVALLAAAADAIELGALSHALDLRVAAALARRAEADAPITDDDYGVAYRAVGHARLRRHQLELVVRIGQALDHAVHAHGLERLLRMSRLPARAAGLGALQMFLERGFSAVRSLHGADAFLATIERQENAVSQRLFAGHKRPFAI